MKVQRKLLTQGVLFFLFLFFSLSFSQKSKTDLLGYQDFQWGMSRKTVESMLKKQKAKIESSDESHILVKSQLDLPSYSALDIEKSFVFRDNKLGRVLLICKQGSPPHNIDKLQSEFRNELEKKYGKSDSSSTETEENTFGGSLWWFFESGSIYMNYFGISKSADVRIGIIARPMENVMIWYQRKDFDEELQRERAKKTSKEL